MDAHMSLRWRFARAQVVVAVVLAACGGGDGGPASPVLSDVQSTDPPRVTSCDLNQARVMVDQVRITQAGGSSIDVTLPEPRPVDLLDPGSGILEALQVAPLTRDALDVRLGVARGSTVRLDNGTEAPLQVAAHLLLVGDFRLASGMEADIVVLGFDRCNAIHAAGTAGQFVLNGEVPAQVRALSSVTDRQ